MLKLFHDSPAHGEDVRAGEPTQHSQLLSLDSDDPALQRSMHELRALRLVMQMIRKLFEGERHLDEQRKEIAAHPDIEPGLVFRACSSRGAVTVDGLQGLLRRHRYYPAHIDVLALFRRHDQRGQGQIGLSDFARSLLPRSQQGAFSIELVAHANTVRRAHKTLPLYAEDLVARVLMQEIKIDSTHNFLCQQLRTVPYYQPANVFGHFDADANGVLSPEEFRRALNDHEIHLTDADLDFLMTRFDRDGDGKVSLADWTDVFTPCKETLTGREAGDTRAPHSTAPVLRLSDDPRLALGPPPEPEPEQPPATPRLALTASAPSAQPEHRVRAPLAAVATRSQAPQSRQRPERQRMSRTEYEAKLRERVRQWSLARDSDTESLASESLSVADSSLAGSSVAGSLALANSEPPSDDEDLRPVSARAHMLRQQQQRLGHRPRADVSSQHLQAAERALAQAGTRKSDTARTSLGLAARPIAVDDRPRHRHADTRARARATLASGSATGTGAGAGVGAARPGVAAGVSALALALASAREPALTDMAYDSDASLPNGAASEPRLSHPPSHWVPRQPESPSTLSEALPASAHEHDENERGVTPAAQRYPHPQRDIATSSGPAGTAGAHRLIPGRSASTASAAAIDVASPAASRAAGSGPSSRPAERALASALAVTARPHTAQAFRAPLSGRPISARALAGSHPASHPVESPRSHSQPHGLVQPHTQPHAQPHAQPRTYTRAQPVAAREVAYSYPRSQAQPLPPTGSATRYQPRAQAQVGTQPRYQPQAQTGPPLVPGSAQAPAPVAARFARPSVSGTPRPPVHTPASAHAPAQAQTQAPSGPPTVLTPAGTAVWQPPSAQAPAVYMQPEPAHSRFTPTAQRPPAPVLVPAPAPGQPDLAYATPRSYERYAGASAGAGAGASIGAGSPFGSRPASSPASAPSYAHNRGSAYEHRYAHSDMGAGEQPTPRQSTTAYSAAAPRRQTPRETGPGPPHAQPPARPIDPSARHRNVVSQPAGLRVFAPAHGNKATDTGGDAGPHAHTHSDRPLTHSRQTAPRQSVTRVPLSGSGAVSQSPWEADAHRPPAPLMAAPRTAAQHVGSAPDRDSREMSVRLPSRAHGYTGGGALPAGMLFSAQCETCGESLGELRLHSHDHSAERGLAPLGLPLSATPLSLPLAWHSPRPYPHPTETSASGGPPASPARTLTAQSPRSAKLGQHAQAVPRTPLPGHPPVARDLARDLNHEPGSDYDSDYAPDPQPEPEPEPESSGADFAIPAAPPLLRVDPANSRARDRGVGIAREAQSVPAAATRIQRQRAQPGMSGPFQTPVGVRKARAAMGESSPVPRTPFGGSPRSRPPRFLELAPDRVLTERSNAAAFALVLRTHALVADRADQVCCQLAATLSFVISSGFATLLQYEPAIGQVSGEATVSEAGLRGFLAKHDDSALPALSRADMGPLLRRAVHRYQYAHAETARATCQDMLALLMPAGGPARVELQRREEQLAHAQRQAQSTAFVLDEAAESAFATALLDIIALERVAERARENYTRRQNVSYLTSFRSLDRDEDGLVSAEDVAHYLNHHEMPLLPAQIAQIIKRYDIWSDGAISYSELVCELLPVK